MEHRSQHHNVNDQQTARHLENFLALQRSRLLVLSVAQHLAKIIMTAAESVARRH